MVIDLVLDGMAEELRMMLVRTGLDPEHPPTSMPPPSDMVFAEYKRRGGTVYTDPDVFTARVVERIGELHRAKSATHDEDAPKYSVAKSTDEHGEDHYMVEDQNGDWVGDSFPTEELAYEEIGRLMRTTDGEAS